MLFTLLMLLIAIMLHLNEFSLLKNINESSVFQIPTWFHLKQLRGLIIFFSCPQVIPLFFLNGKKVKNFTTNQHLLSTRIHGFQDIVPLSHLQNQDTSSTFQCLQLSFWSTIIQRSSDCQYFWNLWVGNQIYIWLTAVCFLWKYRPNTIGIFKRWWTFPWHNWELLLIFVTLFLKIIFELCRRTWLFSCHEPLNILMTTLYLPMVWGINRRVQCFWAILTLWWNA